VAAARRRLNPVAAVSPVPLQRAFSLLHPHRRLAMPRTLLTLLLPLALAACAGTAPDGADSAATGKGTASEKTGAADIASALPRHHWSLRDATDTSGRRIDALFARADAPITLDFKDGRLGVRNACNHMGGEYTLAGDTLMVANMQSTLMACADPKLMALDREAGGRLEGALRAALQPGQPPRLMLTTAGGDVLTFEGEPTAETRYGSVGETVFLEVAADTAACPHPLIPDKQCLQVRELQYDANGVRSGDAGAYRHFYQDIAGYTHEPGVRNVLRVKRYPIEHPPADAPDSAYVLDMVVESESVRP
jgi:heat shock protein HslJ